MPEHPLKLHTPLDRIYWITGCRTQVELSSLLGIRQSSISDAKRRNAVPAEWLVTLVRGYGVNPDWILTGEGSTLLKADPDQAKDGPARPAALPTACPFEATVLRGILQCIPTPYLAEELKRRNENANG